jgi:hypothetical protein
MSVCHEQVERGLVFLNDWSPDSRFLLVHRGRQLLAVPLADDAGRRSHGWIPERRKLPHSPFRIRIPDFRVGLDSL